MMKRSQCLFSLIALLAASLLASCTLLPVEREKQKEAARRTAWYEKHRQHFSWPGMSVVGYEIVPVHGSRKDRGEMSINNRLGVGAAEIPAPRVVLRNPARRPQPMSEQPAVMQLKSSPRQRVPEEVIF